MGKEDDISIRYAILVHSCVGRINLYHRKTDVSSLDDEASSSLDDVASSSLEDEEEVGVPSSQGYEESRPI